jgi:hypothetical protein
MRVLGQMGLAVLRLVLEIFYVVLVGVVVQRSHVPLAAKDLNLYMLFLLWREHGVYHILNVGAESIFIAFLPLGSNFCFDIGGKPRGLV